jgi:Ca2+-binding EF-hand superfamily protein
MVNTAAIVAGRQARANKRPECKTAVTAERIKAKREELQKRAELQELLIKYDKSGTGKLNDSELRAMLTDLDHSTPAGTEPTDEELKFMMSVADWDDSGVIEKSEISYVISAWRLLVAKRSQLTDVLKEFDKVGDGALNKDELKAYLTKLNEGTEVAPEEVDWVWSQADVLGDGSIHGPEIVMASAAWFAYVEDHHVASTAATAASRGGMLVKEEAKIRDTFRKWDCSGTGTISEDDLKSILRKTGVTDEQMDVLFKAMDANQDGKVAYEEFINYLFSDSNTN